MSAKFYISGSALGWEYATGSITAKYSAPGALPATTISEFASLPVGKVWVSTNDDFLYYKDELGTTRFLQGRFRGTASLQEGTGSVFAAKHACPDYSSSVLFSQTNITPAQDIGWTTRGKKYLYRAQQAETPYIHPLYAMVNFDVIAPTLDGSNNATRYYTFQLGLGDWTTEQVGIKTTVSATQAGVAFFKLYTNSTCTSEIGTIYSNQFGGNETLTLPQTPNQIAGTKWFVSSSRFSVTLTGDPALYIRAETGSANVQVGNGGRLTPVNRQYGETFCAGLDQLVMDTFLPGQCISLGSVGGYSPPPPPPAPVNYCGNSCGAIQYAENHPDCGGTCPNCDAGTCVSY